MAKTRFETDPETEILAQMRRGRGAVSNASSRFDKLQYVAFDDGWHSTDEAVLLRTEWIEDHPKSALSYNQSPDVPFDRAVNPYRGCAHGCIYCYARPTHAYLGYSPGLDFETKLHFKPNIAKVLRAELAKPTYRPQPIGFGTNTDPYQPGEREKMLMPAILDLLYETRHPLTITTKGVLINRDIERLARLAAHNLVLVNISLTTLDNHLHRKMEPRAMAPAGRLKTIRALAEAGIPVGVICAPLIPKLNDHELEAMLEAAAKAGARHASFVNIRLPLEIATLFREWLIEHFPDRADKVINHIQALHGGADYRSEFGTRRTGTGVYAQLVKRRFDLAKARLGLRDEQITLNLNDFRKPSSDPNQLSLSL